MIYYCYTDISCVSENAVNEMKRSISSHFSNKVNLKNTDSVVAKYVLCRMLEGIYLLSNYKITADSNGKPYLVDSSLHFSISHSKNMVFCAVSESDIGCDVQVISEYKPKIAERFFTDTEYSILKKSKNQHEDFTKLWILKESILKCTGEGIAGGLSSFDFSDCINRNTFCKYGLNFTTFNKNEYVFSFCSKETESVLYNFKMGGI